MPRPSTFCRYRFHRPTSFTLVEMMVVITVIVILAGLTLMAAGPMMTRAARARASAEMQSMSTALDSYKLDNGGYPTNATITGPPSGTYPVSPTNYTSAAQSLYAALSGKTNFLDVSVSGTRAYFTFKVNQVGNATTTAGTSPGANSSFAQDPFSYPYGYSTGDPTTNLAPYNGAGFFDLWSTSGNLTNAAVWITNWKQ